MGSIVYSCLWVMQDLYIISRRGSEVENLDGTYFGLCRALQ